QNAKQAIEIKRKKSEDDLSSLPAVSSLAPLATAAASFSDPWVTATNGANGHAPPTVNGSPPDIPEGDRGPEAIWRAALVDLEMQMTRGTFASWLRGSWAAPPGDEHEGDKLVVFVKSEQAVAWLDNRLAG